MDCSGGFRSGPGLLSLWILLLLLFCFFVQAFSPLRLNTDAVVLLSMADSAAQGHGFLDDGEKTAFPPGYPCLILALQSVGCAHSWGIIGLNMVLLTLGLAAAYRLIVRSFFENKVVALNLCTLFLLSFVVVKHSTIPVTEAPFFCSAMWCLALMNDSWSLKGRRLIVVLTSALLLVFVSILLRRVGIALIPSLLFATVFRAESIAIWKGLGVRSKAVAVLICVGLAASTASVIVKTSALFDFMVLIHRANLARLPLRILSFRLTELGELFANVPASKLPAAFQGLFPLFGLLLLGLTLVGLYSRRRRKAASTEVFLVCYMAIMFAWPAEADPRFWLPVLPLLLAYSALAVTKGMRVGLPRSAVAVFCVGFCLLGIAAIGYSTRITFAGSRFPDVYGDAALRATYCAAFESCPQGLDHSKVDAKVVRLLRKYN